MKKMHKKLKFGIIGCGSRGLQMAKVIQLLNEKAELIVLADTDRRIRAKAEVTYPDIPVCATADKLFAVPGLDAVLVETPATFHTEISIAALRRNLHVLSDIPLVYTLEEAERLWHAANSSQALFMAGANPNYRSKTLLLQELNRLGIIGKPFYVETEYIHDTRSLFEETPWRIKYESCRYCTHSLGPVMALLPDDEIIAVSCMGTGDHLDCGALHNAMAALYRTRNNVVIRFLTSFSCNYAGPPHITTFYTTTGVIKAYNDRLEIYHADMGKYSQQPDYIRIPLGDIPRDYLLKYGADHHIAHGGADAMMLETFIDAVNNHAPSPFNIRSGLAITIPGIAAGDSALQGGKLLDIHYPWEKIND